MIFCLLFILPSCEESVSEETTALEEETTEAVLPGGSLSVPYLSEDSLNPFYSETVLNSSLSSLVFRSLYRLDTSFSPVKDLAVSESLSGQSLKVYFIEDLVFSDGGVLTGADIVYSFDCAKSSVRYSAALSGISSCSEASDGSVVFTLKNEDVNVLNALIFPIVKNGTAGNEGFLPIGNGFYQYSQDGIRLSLKANLKYAGTLPEIGTVRLTDVSRNTQPENLVAAQEIDFFYSDLSDGSITGVNTSGTGIYLNNLVYMGVNHSNVDLVLASFRQAISLGIDRQALSESAFRGYARGAVVPFNTSWSGYSSSLSFANVSLSGDKQKAQELLAERGFGVDGNPLNFTLVCNESNSFIRNTANEVASALKSLNINVTVQFLSSEKLKSTVKSGLYDLYIAEIKLPSTMDLSAFFSYGGDASSGIIFDNCTSDEAYFSYKKGETGIDEFITAFNKDMPFIPLVYRNGRFLYTRRIISELTATEGFLYSDIYKWTFSDMIS